MVCLLIIRLDYHYHNWVFEHKYNNIKLKLIGLNTHSLYLRLGIHACQVQESETRIGFDLAAFICIIFQLSIFLLFFSPTS